MLQSLPHTFDQGSPPFWKTHLVTTHFVTLSVPMKDSPIHLKAQIEAELRSHGDPLRWAITSIDAVSQQAQVEAVVTTLVPREGGFS